MGELEKLEGAMLLIAVVIGLALGAIIFLGIPAAWPYIKAGILWLLDAPEVKP